MTVTTGPDRVRTAGGRLGAPLTQVAGWVPENDDDLAAGAQTEDRRHPAQEMLELFHFASRLCPGLPRTRWRMKQRQRDFCLPEL